MSDIPPGDVPVFAGRYGDPLSQSVHMTAPDGTVWAVKPDDPRLVGVVIDDYLSPPASTTVTATQFWTRFNATERSAMWVAGIQGAVQGNGALQDWLNTTSLRQDIDLADPVLSADLQNFVALGAITPERVEEITGTVEPPITP